MGTCSQCLFSQLSLFFYIEGTRRGGWGGAGKEIAQGAGKETYLLLCDLPFREEKTALGTGEIPLVCFHIPAYFYGSGTLCTTPTEHISVDLY